MKTLLVILVLATALVLSQAAKPCKSKWTLIQCLHIFCALTLSLVFSKQNRKVLG